MSRTEGEGKDFSTSLLALSRTERLFLPPLSVLAWALLTCCGQRGWQHRGWPLPTLPPQTSRKANRPRRPPSAISTPHTAIRALGATRDSLRVCVCVCV